MSNKELAEVFFEIADILELEDTRFKPAAYRKAARSILNLPEDVSTFKEKIPGVGEAIAKKIDEYLKTGKITKLEELRQEILPGIVAMMKVPGIGPKRAKMLHAELGIKSIDALEKAAREGKIHNLPGFKEKIEADILDALSREKGKRYPRSEIEPLANEICRKLKARPEVVEMLVAGSIRRKKGDVKDIDIVGVSKEPEKTMDYFAGLGEKVVAKGETKTSIIRNGIEIDLRLVPKEGYGAAVVYFTGSKDHNIELRNIAKKRGYKLNEYGLFGEDGKIIAGKKEEDIYKALGLKMPKPEERI